ncbi:hypothetical protein [Ruegeria jejuensis]|uniref:hypothetical protein n=1 Tax=Ruegeria jejuensis TaxID=3233338 RepID=UPI00355B2026
MTSVKCRERREFLKRYDEVTRMLGVEQPARWLFQALDLEPIGWWRKDLAEGAGISRGNMDGKIDRNIEAGYLYVKSRKIYISDAGSRVLSQVEQQTTQIVLGNQRGFTDDLIRHFRDLPRNTIDPRARTIRYERRINPIFE